MVRVSIFRLDCVHQPQVSLMDERRGLESLAGLFLGQSVDRQLAQFVVDQRQELLGGVRIALLHGGQDSCDLTHNP